MSDATINGHSASTVPGTVPGNETGRVGGNVVDRERYNAYMRAYMAKRYERRKAEAIHALGGRCVDCGSTEDLEFDHKDGSTKRYAIAKRIAGAAERRIKAELSKCVLRCRQCHQVKTFSHDVAGKSLKAPHLIAHRDAVASGRAA